MLSMRLTYILNTLVTAGAGASRHTKLPTGKSHPLYFLLHLVTITSLTPFLFFNKLYS